MFSFEKEGMLYDRERFVCARVWPRDWVKFSHSTLGLLPNACHPACPLPPAHPSRALKNTGEEEGEGRTKRKGKRPASPQTDRSGHAAQCHLLPSALTSLWAQDGVLFKVCLYWILNQVIQGHWPYLLCQAITHTHECAHTQTYNGSPAHSLHFRERYQTEQTYYKYKIFTCICIDVAGIQVH